MENNVELGGAFKYFVFMFIPTWGDDSIWRAYFFKQVETTNE